MISSREVIKRLRAAGWYKVRSKGDHEHYAHDEKPGLVTVKHPAKDLGIKLIEYMEKQAGMKLR